MNNPPMQIPTGCDGSVNPDGPFNLLMAPAERADLIIDFSSVPAGSNLILYNDAPAPFPMGDPRVRLLHRLSRPDGRGRRAQHRSPATAPTPAR